MSTPGPSSASDIARQPSHSRQASVQDRSNPQPSRASPTLTPKPIEYTVVIRLPFSRNDFVDPAPVEWDAVKDKALWKIISKGSDSRDLDWEDIANRFDVSLQFLMKQAAWLYERHFAGVRKQMQRLVTTSVPVSKTQDGADSNKLPPLNTAASVLRRDGSKHSLNATSPRLQGSLVPQEEQSLTPKLNPPPFSRTPSTTTITQSKLFTSARSMASRPQRASTRLPLSSKQQDLQLSDSIDDSQSTRPRSGLAEGPSIVQSQAFRRPPLSSKPTGLSSEGDIDDGDEDDEDGSSSIGYLPFATGLRPDPTATLREELGRPNTAKGKRKETTSSSASSASSMPPALSSMSNSRDLLTGPKPGPLSPKHRSQLRHLSQRSTKDGSDGTPSMGSSFSDLDDAGISASAIEDAVLSTMQAGGGSIASRVSGLSQAFRSQR